MFKIYNRKKIPFSLQRKKSRQRTFYFLLLSRQPNSALSFFKKKLDCFQIKNINNPDAFISRIVNEIHVFYACFSFFSECLALKLPFKMFCLHRNLLVLEIR